MRIMLKILFVSYRPEVVLLSSQVKEPLRRETSRQSEHPAHCFVKPCDLLRGSMALCLNTSFDIYQLCDLGAVA